MISIDIQFLIYKAMETPFSLIKFKRLMIYVQIIFKTRYFLEIKRENKRYTISIKCRTYPTGCSCNLEVVLSAVDKGIIQFNDFKLINPSHHDFVKGGVSFGRVPSGASDWALNVKFEKNFSKFLECSALASIFYF